MLLALETETARELDVCGRRDVPSERVSSYSMGTSRMNLTGICDAASCSSLRLASMQLSRSRRSREDIQEKKVMLPHYQYSYNVTVPGPVRKSPGSFCDLRQLDS